MSRPLLRWRPWTEGTGWTAKMGDLRLFVATDPVMPGWNVVVERASDGAIVAAEASYPEIEDAKAQAIWLPWEGGEVE